MTDPVSDRGYALTEALVAMVIAAGTVATVMSGLATSARAARATETRIQSVSEAQNLEARLRAGVPLNQIVERYPDWRIEVGPAGRPVDPRSGAILTVARLTRTGPGGLMVEFVYLEPGALQSDQP